MTEKQELALVLGGGAARGLAHIGVIKFLEKNNISPNVVIGTSIGALIGGMYAASRLDKFEKDIVGKTKKEMKKMFRIWPTREGLIKTNRLGAELRRIIGERKIEELDKKFIAVAVDLLSGKKILFDKGDLCEAIMASMAIPVLFPPIHKQDMLLVDGGLEAPLDVDDGFEYANKIIAVNTTPLNEAMPKKPRYNLVDIFQRALAIVQLEILNDALKKHKENLVLLNPEVKIGFFDFSRAKEAIAIGEQEAEKHLNNINRLLKR